MRIEQPELQESPEQEGEKQEELERFDRLFNSAVLPLADTTEGLHEHVPYLSGNKKAANALKHLEAIPAEKIETESLREILTNTDQDKRSLTLRHRAKQDLTKLYDQATLDEALKQSPSTEWYTQFTSKLITARERATPAIDALIHTTDYLDQLELMPQKLDETEINFLANTASHLHDRNQQRIYFLFNSLRNLLDERELLTLPPGIIVLIAKHGSEAQKTGIENIVYNAFTAYTLQEPRRENMNATLDWFKKVNRIGGRRLNAIMSQALDRARQWFKGRYKMDLQEILKGHPIPMDKWPGTIGTIAHVEDQKPGGAKILSEKYGIRCFYRYPSHLLRQQLEDEKEHSPYGVMTWAYDDYNDAFAHEFQKLIRLESQLARNGMIMRIIETGSGIDFMKRLVQLNKQYGAHHKISFLVISAHGQENSFLLSEQTKSKSSRVKKEMLQGKGVQAMKDFFVPHPEMVLLSCFTGTKDGIAEEVSKTFDTHVTASDKLTGIRDISVSFDKEKRPHFEVTFSEKDSLREYGAHENSKAEESEI